MPQLTQIEIVERAKRLANLQRNLHDTKEAARSDARDHRQTIKELEADIELLSTEIRTGSAIAVQESLPTIKAGSGPDTPAEDHQ